MLQEMLSIRKRRLELQREADILEQKEKAIQESLIQFMVSRELDSVHEGEDICYLQVTDEPLVNSWPDLLKYIRETDSLDMLQKRVTPSAIKARWADNVVIPGVSAVPKRSLKFNI